MVSERTKWLKKQRDRKMLERQVCGTVCNGFYNDNTSFLWKCSFTNTKEIRKRVFSGLSDKMYCPITSIKISVVIQMHWHLIKTDSRSDGFLKIVLSLLGKECKLESNPSIF